MSIVHDVIVYVVVGVMTWHLVIDVAGYTDVGYLTLKAPPLGILFIVMYFMVYSAGSEMPCTDCDRDLVTTSAKSVVCTVGPVEVKDARSRGVVAEESNNWMFEKAEVKRVSCGFLTLSTWKMI